MGTVREPKSGSLNSFIWKRIKNGNLSEPLIPGTMTGVTRLPKYRINPDHSLDPVVLMHGTETGGLKEQLRKKGVSGWQEEPVQTGPVRTGKNQPTMEVKIQITTAIMNDFIHPIV